MKYYIGDASRAASGLPSDTHLQTADGPRRSPSFSLPPERRLRKASDFQAVRNSSKSLANPLLALRYRPNGLNLTRLGFSVGKRLGNAVVRNKVKRRLRELTRQAPLKAGWDLIFTARSLAAQASYLQLAQSASDLLSRAGLLLPVESGDDRL
ncbi:MAG: ribonuclease P protein component [Chloroflexi bacterium]|nr:ribonuclease P protein component [Chloroflexota bacterium]